LKNKGVPLVKKIALAKPRAKLTNKKSESRKRRRSDLVSHGYIAELFVISQKIMKLRGSIKYIF
jgi:hypothetical protein